MKWVTRARPKTDRIARPLADPSSYVKAGQLLSDRSQSGGNNDVFAGC